MAFKFSFIKQATLYKYRHVYGYAFLLTILVLILSLDINTLPNGLSQAEMNSAVVSNQIGPRLTFDWVVNAPYHLLQKLSVNLLGLSRLSIVLPSLFFGTATIVLFMLTARQWFRESVAFIATAIAITTAAFTGAIRSGVPDIMLSFWTVLLLFAAVRLLVKQDRAFVWKIIIAVSAVGLLYTPLGVYPLGAFVISGLAHPHVRSRLRKIKLYRKFILVTLTIILLTPLVIHISLQPASLANLVGIDTLSRLTFDNIAWSIKRLFVNYFGFWRGGLIGTSLLPTFGLTSVILMLMGLLRCIYERHTARSYALLTWTAVVAIASLVVPDSWTLVLMPALLLLAIGVETLIVNWYQLFPRNPYARFAGLIPLTVLFVGVSMGNLTHYFYTYRYTANTAYSHSLPAIEKSLAIEADRSTLLVTDQHSLDFYRLLQRRHKNLSVETAPPTEITKPTFVLPTVQTKYEKPPSQILTSYEQSNGVSLRVYRPQ